MKLGQTCYCPTTGEEGRYIGIRGGVKWGRAADGRMFAKAKRTTKGIPGTTCEVRVRGLPGENWMVAEWLNRNRLKIVSPDPLWHGAELGEKEVAFR